MSQKKKSTSKKDIYEWIRKHDDGKGLSAHDYYDMYGYGDFPPAPDSGNDDAWRNWIEKADDVFDNRVVDMSFEEFQDILDELCNEGKLYTDGNLYSCRPLGMDGAISVGSINELAALASLSGKLYANVIERTSDIGDTGFDMFDWTFTENIKQKYNGVIIAIPDGFVSTDFDDEQKIELLVPQGMDASDNSALHCVHISISSIIKVDGDMRAYHPHARNGLAKMAGNSLYKKIQSNKASDWMIGAETPVLTALIDDGFATFLPVNVSHDFIADDLVRLLNNDDIGAYSFAGLVVVGNKLVSFTITTGMIDSSKKDILLDSLAKWVSTFKCDVPNDEKYELLITSEKVYNDMIKGRTSSLKKAVDEATREMRLALYYGKEEYFATDEKLFKSYLADVNEFYCGKANELIERLKNANVNRDVLEKAYTILLSLKMTVRIEADDEDIYTIEFTSRKSKKIIKQWKSDKKKIEDDKKREKKEKEEEKKRKEKEKEVDRKLKEIQKQETARDIEEEALLDSENENHARNLIDEQKNFNENITVLNIGIDNRRECIERLQNEISVLKFYQYTKKNELLAEIKKNQHEISQMMEDKAEIQKKYQLFEKEENERFANEKNKIISQMNEKYPLTQRKRSN